MTLLLLEAVSSLRDKLTGLYLSHFFQFRKKLYISLYAFSSYFVLRIKDLKISLLDFGKLLNSVLHVCL